MADNLYAGSSVQVFAEPGLENLEHTHEDAIGFLDYVSQFNQPNFRITDGDVAQWRFDPVFDDAQGWRGTDSVKVYYHGGHGVIDGRGVYEAPMGSVWATRMSAFSDAMRLGDQKLRYLFLSTCESVCVTGGDDPLRTWSEANRGIRMVFGFGSTSLDWWAYGQNFFRIWNTGASFSQAWQDASLALTFNQIVSSTACGATAEEAQARLWNERLFSGERARDDWFWWRWAGISPDVEVGVHVGIGVPGVPLHFRVARSRDERLLQLADTFGVRIASAQAADPGSRETPGASEHVTLGDDGTIVANLTAVDVGAELATVAELRAAADRVVRGLDPDGRLDLVFDRFTSTFHAGASREGETVDATVADFTAHYRQRFEGVPATMGGAGHVAVTLDRAGRPCRILDRSVEVIAVDEAAAPPEPGDATAETGIQDLLDEIVGRRHDPCGDRSIEFDPDADEVGYRFVDGEGFLVARREVTVVSGRVRKAHLVEVPIGSRAGFARASTS